MSELQSIHLTRGKAGPDSTYSAQSFKVLLYSHDSWGLGHFRRNLAIAGELVRNIPNANVLLLCGCPCATQFTLPERCDVIKVPSVSKDSKGRYVTRRLSISLNETLLVRRRVIMTAFESFDPDVVVVDHQPTGLLGEASEMVRSARKAGKLTIFGMRDIIDSAHVVEQAWSSRECKIALDSDYERICIYGDASVFDAAKEYPVLKPFRHKICMTGYIVSPRDNRKRWPVPPIRKQVLVIVGGGEDGDQRVQAYLDGLSLAPFDCMSHIITGPLMDGNKVRGYKTMVKKAGFSDCVRVSRFHHDIPGQLQQADAVVSMAGYNSCTEILQSGTPALLLPRVHFRMEQRIRAERLADLGLVQSLTGFDSPSLRQATERVLSFEPNRSEVPDLNGLMKMCEIISGVAGSGNMKTPGLAQADNAQQRGGIKWAGQPLKG